MKTALEIADILLPTFIGETNPFFTSEMIPAINGFISNAANDNAPDVQ